MQFIFPNSGLGNVRQFWEIFEKIRIGTRAEYPPPPQKKKSTAMYN